MNTDIPPAHDQHALPENTPFIVGDTPDAVPPTELTDLDEGPSPEQANANPELLASLSIDQLRVLAMKLGVPDVGSVTESDALMDAIRTRLCGTAQLDARSLSRS